MKLFDKKQEEKKYEKKPKRRRQWLNRIAATVEKDKKPKSNGNSFYFHANRENTRRDTKTPLSQIRLKNRAKNKKARASRKKNRHG